MHRFVLLGVLLAWSTHAHAGTVAIVKRSNPSPLLTETQSRLHGELLSVGLEVRWLERPSNAGLSRSDSQTWLQAVAAADRLDAAIDIVGDVAPVAIDVWIIDHSLRRVEVLRATLEPSAENASEQLAIRAVELLRSTFLEHDMVARELPSRPVAKPAITRPTRADSHTPQSHAPESALNRLGVEAGVAVLASLDRVGPAFLPVVGFDWMARPWLVLEFTLAPLGTQPTLTTPAGHARITQQYAMLGGQYRFQPDKPWSPYLALSAGALHTSVDGRADSPREGHTVGQWSLMLDGSLGMALRLSNRYFWTLAGHVQVAEKYTAIHFMDAVVATTGRPNLALVLTLGAWL